jgi:ABC-type transporter MlaC component
MKLTYLRLLLLALSLLNQANATESTTNTISNKMTITIAKTVDCNPNTPCFIIKSSAIKLSTAVNTNLSTVDSEKMITDSIVPQINFNIMTKLAIGKRWNESSLITNNQKAQITNLFQQLLIFQYSKSLSKFQGAQVSISNSSINKDNPDKAAVIGTIKMPSNGNSQNQAINLEYSLAKINSAWKVYDIKIENVSIVTTYRNQFNEILQSQGTKELINQLQSKVSNLKTQ